MSGYLAALRALPSLQIGLLLLLATAVMAGNIRQPYPEVAPLQHLPTVAAILAAPLLLRRWPLSTASVGAIVAFLLLHTFAGRYTYSNVPYDAWSLALTGQTVSAAFGLARNDFDRIVHFSFGLLAVAPVAEASRRHGGVSCGAALWSAFLFVGAASALYEIFEWLLTIILAPEMADDYNGQQGDLWDSQKDMAMAILGGAVGTGWQWAKRRASPRARILN